jgi:membrane fusion protein (multidrug efflux system)
MIKRLLVAGIIVAALLGGLGYFQMFFKPQMIRGFITKNVPPPAAVAAEPAKTERWIEQLTSIGTLTASQGIEVASQVAGIVKDVHFDSSMDVLVGAPLISLDTAVEQADLASTQASQREAELAYARQADLIRRNVTSEANLDTAKAKRDTTAAAVKKIEAVIAQKNIVAPFAGRLGIRKVEKGQYVAPGVSLVSLQALDPIRADFPMPEATIGKLKVGLKIEAMVDAHPGQVFQGEIQSLDARVAADTRTLLVRAIIRNPDRKLLPGMFVNVSVLAGDPVEVVTVPRTSVTYSLYGDSVFVVKPAPAATGSAEASPALAQPGAAGNSPAVIAERRFVKTGQAREGRVAILSGITAGETIVTTGQLKLSPSARIRVDNSQPLERVGDRPRQ